MFWLSSVQYIIIYRAQQVLFKILGTLSSVDLSNIEFIIQDVPAESAIQKEDKSSTEK